MSQLLNSTAYDVKPDSLIQDSKHPIDVTTVSVDTGVGVLRRGTVLSLTSENKYVVMGTTLGSGVTAKANCVVCDDVDTTASTGGTTAVPVYISGSLNKNALTVEEGYTLTQTDIEDLRNAGIFISSANTK